MKLIPLGLCLAAVCYAQTAQAAMVFSMPGSACVPNSTTIKDDRALVGNASVGHAAGNLDPIALTCPITPFDPGGETGWTLRMTYEDSTGGGAGAFVRARLFRMTIGGTTPVLVAGAVANSNSEPDTGVTTVVADFTHTFVFAESVYWIRVDLDRSSTGQTAILYSVTLRDAGPSDIRLKHNVALLGYLDNGLGLYRFSYHGSDKAYVGVMAQEVEAIRPDAVIRGSDGYLRVSYSELGLRLQSWEEWVASGERIPAIAAP